MWYNPFFVWDPRDFGNATKIVVTSKDIWVPEIEALNRYANSVFNNISWVQYYMICISGLDLCIGIHLTLL